LFLFIISSPDWCFCWLVVIVTATFATTTFVTATCSTHYLLPPLLGIFKLGELEPPTLSPVLDVLLRTLRFPLALRFRIAEGVCSMSDKSKLAGAFAGAGATGAGLGSELPNKHIRWFTPHN
jgi:hypothetical protein